jgi:hypothetical protein
MVQPRISKQRFNNTLQPIRIETSFEDCVQFWRAHLCNGLDPVAERAIPRYSTLIMKFETVNLYLK